MPFLCAVPPNLPPNREGVRTFPGAGPYTITDYRPNQRVTIRRNPHYGGTRPHHVNGYDVDLTAGSPEELLDRIENGKADWGYTLAPFHLATGRGLLGKFALNYERFWLEPGLTMSMYVFNNSSPLFRENPRLRQAVNFAIKRGAFGRPAFYVKTDQYLPPSVPGFRQRKIYPEGSDLDRAKALAAGNLRGGKAVVLVPNASVPLGSAQSLKTQLAEIGLEVEIVPFGEHATASAYLGRLGDRNEQWDLALLLWTPDFVDPAGYINRLLDTEQAGGTNLARFDEPMYLDLMRRAARLQGPARTRAYAELELRLARDAAPLLPIGVLNEATLLSARVDTRCLLLRPSLVLTTVCLKRL